MKLVICGNYGASNLGDEAILDGILLLIRGIDPDAHITVFSANPSSTEALHGVKSVYHIPAGPRSFVRGLFSGHIYRTYKALKECDGFILGGGGLLTDDKMMAMVIWPLQAFFARLMRKPVFCLGQSVGPLRTFLGRMACRNVYGKAMLSTVRDNESRRVLHGLGMPRPVVLADPAFLVHVNEPALTERENIIVLALRDWQKNWTEPMFNIFAHFVDWAWSQYGLKSILVPFSQSPENDASILYNIFAHLKNANSCTIFEYSGDYRKVIELIARSKAVVGMRLHSLVFSTLTATPFLALPYSDKVMAMVNDLQMPDYLINWHSLTLDDLKEGLGRLVKNHESLSRRLGEQNLLMRAKARSHEEILRTFFDLIKTPRP